MNGLPGIEVLFREHRRLANKLTKEELKALKCYISDRLLQENGETVLQLENMKTEHAAIVLQLQDKISDLTSELDFKTKVLEQFKSSDESLANVHKQRGQRLEHRQSILIMDIEKRQDIIKGLEKENDVLQTAIANKDKELEMYNETVQKLERKMEEEKEIQIQDEGEKIQKLSQEILRLKLEIDRRNKDCQKMSLEIEKLTTERDQAIARRIQEEEKAKDIQDKFMKHIQEFRAKCDKLALAEYHLEVERSKVMALDKELQRLRHCNGKRQAEMEESELTRVRGESLRSQIQFIESRVKILEEKIAMYRNEIRSVSQEITMITEDVTKSSQLRDRIFVHGQTVAEKVLIELCDNILKRQGKLESLLAELYKTAQDIVAKDACGLRADTLTLKKQAENQKANDVVVRASRILTRIDNCEKAQFSSKHLNGNPFVLSHIGQMERVKTMNELRPKRTEQPDEKCFTVVNRKPSLNGSLLSRPKYVNGPSASLWKRKHSVSMDVPCISPTFIDLSISSPSNSPSPREKKSFFPHSVSMTSIDEKNGNARYSKPASDSGVLLD